MEKNIKTEKVVTKERKRKKSSEDTEISKNSDLMGTLPVQKLLFSMSWPAILMMSIAALYNVVDSIFVAMLGQNDFTGVSLVMPMQMLIISVGVGSGIGVNSLISRRLGEKRFKEADQAASTSVRIAVLNYLLFLFIGVFLTKPFIGNYTDNPEVFKSGVVYMRIICCGSFFFMMQLLLEKVLQGEGNMKAPLKMGISGAAVNLVLDPVLIFGLIPGMKPMGVAGAAIATVTGQCVAMCVGVYQVSSKKTGVKIKIKGFSPDWKIIKDIYAVGLPSIIMQAISSAMLTIYNLIIADCAAAVAVLGIYYKLFSFVFMPVFGLTQGALTLMGYNYGAANRDRLMETFKNSMIGAIIHFSIWTFIFQAFPNLLLNMFSSSPEMVEIGIPALRLISLSFILASLDIIGATLFQATGHGMYSLISSILRQFVGILPIAWVLYNKVGLKASWASFPLAEIIGFIYVLIMMIRLYNNEIKDL